MPNISQEDLDKLLQLAVVSRKTVVYGALGGQRDLVECLEEVNENLTEMKGIIMDVLEDNYEQL